VYVGSGTARIYALDALTGNTIWSFGPTFDSVWATPAVADGVVYAQTLRGRLYALDASTGTLLWTFNTQATTNNELSSTAVANGVAYQTSADGNVYALSAISGSLLWQYTTAGRTNSAVIADSKLFITSSDGKIYAFSGETGPTISDFVVLGELGVFLKQGAQVDSGDIATNFVSPGPFLAEGAETTIGLGVSLLDPESKVYGDSVFLKNNSVVYDVFYNDISGSGTIFGQQHTPFEFPIISTLPSVPSFTVGTQDVDVVSGNSQVLAEGAYGDLNMGPNAILILSGGVYNFRSWDINHDAKIYVQTTTEIRIEEKMDTDERVEIVPATGSVIGASDIKIYVIGINGSNGNIGATPKAAKFGQNNILRANVYVPNGTLLVRANSVMEGAFLGKWVIAGQNTQLFHNPAF
jgi:outer membrane protein assembly factor BamB